MILDGKAVTIGAWLADPRIQGLVDRRHIVVPALDAIAGDVEPVPAFLNWGRWVTWCPEPECFGQAEDVGPDHPAMLCMRCGNVAIGRRWRPVAFPADRAEIEASVGPLPKQHQNWDGGATVALFEGVPDG